jgi:hypothetical protein
MLVDVATHESFLHYFLDPSVLSWSSEEMAAVCTSFLPLPLPIRLLLSSTSATNTTPTIFQFRYQYDSSYYLSFLLILRWWQRLILSPIITIWTLITFTFILLLTLLDFFQWYSYCDYRFFLLLRLLLLLDETYFILPKCFFLHALKYCVFSNCFSQLKILTKDFLLKCYI